MRDTLKLKLVKNPATGEESVPVHDKTVMLSGNRRSAARVREESCADRQTAKEEFKQAREGMQVKVNSKDCVEKDAGLNSLLLRGVVCLYVLLLSK